MTKTYGIGASVLALLAIGALAVASCSGDKSADSTAEEWIPLFNGKDLSDWTPKFSGFEAGENYNNTFRWEDGMLRVVYDDWDSFNGEFGHIFYNTPYSNYRIRFEYRFVGDQVENGPEWAIRNNGVMVHAQSPQSMGLDQDFPDSIEVQLLGGNGVDERSTGNLCTPQTNVVMNGGLYTIHCTESSSATYSGDQWVKAEVEVRGNKVIRHYINDELVMEYTDPQLGGEVPEEGPVQHLSEGFIAFQAESHPTDIRNVEVLVLKDE